MTCDCRASMVAALQAVLIALLVVVVAAPAVGAQNAEETERSGQQPESSGEPETPGDAAECGDLYALGEWTLARYEELIDCLFDLPESPDTGGKQATGTARASKGGVARQSASECGDVDVEHVAQQYLPERSSFGFVIGHLRIHLMYLTCEDGSPAAGYRTGLQVVAGPNRGEHSRYCLVRRDDRIVEESTSRANGCPSYIGGDPTVAVAAHLHRISYRDDRRFRQVLMWADIDGNGSHDGGEPYDIAFSPDDGRSESFSIPETIGSLARRGALAGQQVLVVDSLGVPLGDTAVSADIVIGPNQGAAVTCRNTRPRTASGPVQAGSCITGADGWITLIYRAAAGGAVLERQELDVLRAFLDTDGDGRYSTGEPFQYTTIRIAEPINYVALGDSYSSGEAGEDDDHEFQGIYRTGKPADPACRRWNMAYPFNVDDYLLGGAFTIDSYACTGAITLNIHDPNNATNTRRPSPAAEEFDPDAEQQDDDWEPRQAVSLEAANDLRSVDMVTLTIGGNDAGFGPIIQQCVGLSASCEDAALVNSLSAISARVVDVISEVRLVAPEASIFLLGYPLPVPLGSERGTFCESLTASGVLSEVSWGPFFLSNLLPAIRLLNAVDETGTLSLLEVSAREAEFLRRMGTMLNETVETAARVGGAYFVEVARPHDSTAGAESFDGHAPCDRDEAWLHGASGESASSSFPPTSGRSFHPNAAGHEAYARLLARFIENAVDAGATLTDAGLPVSPDPVGISGLTDGARAATGDGRSYVGGKDSPGRLRSADAGVGSSSALRGSADETANTGDEETPDAGTVLLLQRRLTEPATDCARPFVAPGEQVELEAEGFEADSSVVLSARGVTLSGTALAPAAISEATADSEGRLAVRWTVPTESEIQGDQSPRAYALEASGTGADGGTLKARMAWPLVAYPGAPSCALADAASTAVGQPVRVAVLANDTVAPGGSWDVASVAVRPVAAGDFAVDSSGGSVTFTPDPGFVGAVTADYVVFDGWGVGVHSEVTVTVSAGCTVTGTAGVVRIEGTDGDDVICVPDSSARDAFHIIDAKGGNDIVLGGDGVEWVYGGAGQDVIYALDGDDLIDAGTGIDTIFGGAGFDTIYSADLADTVHDDPSGHEIIITPETSSPAAPTAGSDQARVEPSATVLIGVLDNDYDHDDDLDEATLKITRVPASGTAAVAISDELGAHVSYTASSAAGSDTFAYEVCDHRGGCTIAEVIVVVGTTGCTIIGTEASDTLRGTPGDDVICGLGGNDTIHGLGGNDTIVGGDGDDTLYGNGGNDTIVGSNGDDTIRGGDGDDTLFGGDDDDTLSGGSGADSLWGGDGNDTLDGNAGDDTLSGNGGADTAVGGGDDDTIWGGPGHDNIDGHAGNDTVHAGTGDDMVRGGNGDDTLRGGPGDDTLHGWAGADSLWGGDGTDALWGHTQNDTLRGGRGDDTLHGGGHNDTLHGGNGTDSIYGNAGDDYAYGGLGDDTLDGGNGTDYLNAGAGTDSCRRGETTAQCEN